MLADNHDEIVNDWKANAQKNDDRNYMFLRSLKVRTSSKKVDRVTSGLNEQVFQIVDCTRCSNCCRTLQPEFTDADIARIANYLGVTRDQLIAEYLDWDEDNSQYRTKSAPCPLLAEDGKCSVYSVRPKTCEEFPHFQKPDLVFNTMTRANHALVCPAAFAIVEEMRERLR